MKAKVIKTGEIVDVKEWRGASSTIYTRADMNAFYEHFEIELISDKPEDISLCGWICRDKDGDLNFFYGGDKPRKEDGEDYWCATFGSNIEYLPKSLYPNVTWETEPLKVKLTLTPIE